MDIKDKNMSKINRYGQQMTVSKILAYKMDKIKLSMVTCYDSSFARLIDKTDIELILVGDSLGNVMLGFDNTLKVTMGHMVHHTAAVTRSVERVFVCADMPFMSYRVSKEEALKNAMRLIQEGGAQAVKLEGGEEVIENVKAIVDAGIPVMGHLGLTPQSINQIGGYKVQGRGDKAKDKLIKDARLLQDAGAFALVLEMVPKGLGRQLSKELKIPVIGIGAGPDCDGQVLVLQDLLGFDNEFNPRFLKKYGNFASIVHDALQSYNSEVKGSIFPSDEHSFKDCN